MIDLTQYANIIEVGLNNALNDSYLKFVVWSDMGKFKRPERNGNTVTTYINCLLTRAPGTINTGNNGLVIATDSLTLQIAVPTRQPRSTAEAPSPEVEDDVYVFVEQIRNIVDDYFSHNVIQSFTEGDKTYQAGMQYSLSATGDADIAPMLANYITFSVYITVNVVQNGINSREVSIELDGETIPFLTASPNRACERSSDTYSDGGETENIITTTALSIDVAQPATTGKVTSQFTDYLLRGNRNMFHFLKLTIGDDSEIYPVTFGDTSASADGVLNMGTTIPFIRVRSAADLLRFPTYFTVVRFVVTSFGSINFTVNGECIYAYANQIVKTPGGATSITVDEDMCEYDGENYFLQIRFCPTGTTAVTVTNNSSLSMQTEQQGVLNA